MKTSFLKGKKRVTIDPGEYYVTSGDEIISTLLGSCVSACLWDPKTGIVGMNHFLLASRSLRSNTPLILSESGRYGINAMELLINAMLQKGAERRRLQAKVFGGGNVLPAGKEGVQYFDIGQVNSQFIMEFLRMERIPLIASSLGGDYGRVIHLTACDFSVYMKRIETQVQRKVVEQERSYLKQQLENREQERPGSVNVW